MPIQLPLLCRWHNRAGHWHLAGGRQSLTNCIAQDGGKRSNYPIHTATCHRADGVRFDCYRRRYVLHELPRLLWRDTWVALLADNGEWYIEGLMCRKFTKHKPKYCWSVINTTFINISKNQSESGMAWNVVWIAWYSQKFIIFIRNISKMNRVLCEQKGFNSRSNK